MVQLRALFVRLACAVVCASAGACTAPADASVLLDLEAFANNGLPELRAPRAMLDVVDASEGGDGAHLAVDVKLGDGEVERVQSPLPVPCEAGGTCAVQLRVRPGPTSFVLHVTSEDRCGARGEIVALRSDVIELERFSAPVVELEDATFAFDDDEDGVMNVLEHATCGRFDVEDGAAPPQACRDEGDACCAGVSELEGHETAFEGGAFVDANGDDVDVAPFALDATEVTWRQLARCVAAGACLVDRPEHPARLALEVAPANEPVTGLTPRDAAALCAFYGKRLPTDAEWDFAAAHRDDPTTRARFPWDGDATDVGCSPEHAGVAANFSLAGAACPGAPVAVGSYPTSHASRGAGAPLADLAGNVAEWTLIPGDDAPAIDEVPPGTDGVVLRGGGARSPLLLLENDLPVAAPYPASGDVDAWRADIARLADSAGFRCARDVDDGTIAPAPPEEPSCGGDE